MTLSLRTDAAVLGRMNVTLLRVVLGLGMVGILSAQAQPALFAPRALSREPSAPMMRSGAGNILADAKITASHAEKSQPAAFASDGVHDDNILHWAAKKLPAWIAFELPESRTVAQVNLWFFSGGERQLKFIIEGSADGAAWTVLHDQSKEAQRITMRGLVLKFTQPMAVRWLRLTVTDNAKEDEGAMVLELAAYAHTDDGVLGGGVVDVHRRVEPADLPVSTPKRDWQAVAWRGERVNGQFLVWTEHAREGLRASVSTWKGPDGAVLSSDVTTVRNVKNVTADGELAADLLDTDERLAMPAGSYRALWLTLSTPRDASPGRYVSELTVKADGCEPLVFPLSIEILPALLPEPKDWAFHLDLWQHPWAIARWHDVKPWSDEHLALMKPYLTELAAGGQKVITTTITDRPWGRRDYDDYRSMVTHVKKADGTWAFDYTVFDRYVSFAMSCGIVKQINAYALLTWSGRLYYTDETTGEERFNLCDPAQPGFAEYWAPFLRDFEQHLASKGWLERTRLAIDEAPAPMMKAVMALVREHAPKLRVSLAGNQAPSHYEGLDLAEFSIILDHASDDLLRDIATRRAEGRITTFYVCLDPKRPNTFVKSPPAEAVWIGYYAAVNGYDGFLRWAWTTWPENPLRDTTYWGHPYEHYLPAGDTFLIYPGPRGAMRWEMLRDGIEENEKLAVIRAAHAGKWPGEITRALEIFRDPKKMRDDESVMNDVMEMRKILERESRTLK